MPLPAVARNSIKLRIKLANIRYIRKRRLKRDSIVADYLATVKRLQHREINERAQDLVRQDDLNRMFEPVIESTVKSTGAITKELVPIREEMKTLNELLADTTGKMKDAITMKQQHPTNDHTSTVLEQ